jgi:hypothetical protein
MLSHEFLEKPATTEPGDTDEQTMFNDFLYMHKDSDFGHLPTPLLQRSFEWHPVSAEVDANNKVDGQAGTKMTASECEESDWIIPCMFMMPRTMDSHDKLVMGANRKLSGSSEESW